MRIKLDNRRDADEKRQEGGNRLDTTDGIHTG